VAQQVGGRVPAGGEAAVLERRELEGAGQPEGGRAHQPRVRRQPGEGVGHAVHAVVEGQRRPPEQRPDGEVPGCEAGQQPPGRAWRPDTSANSRRRGTADGSIMGPTITHHTSA